MKKALLVARWEFLCTVTRRAYIFAVVIMPLFFTVIAAVPILTGRSANRGGGSAPIALVDRAGIVDVALAADAANRRRAAQTQPAGPGQVAASSPIETYDDLDRALADLKAGRVSAVYALDEDYLTSGRVTAYGRDTGFMAQAFAGQRQTQIADAIRVSLMKEGFDGDRLTRAYAPLLHMDRQLMMRTGEIRPVDDPLGLGPFFGSFAVLMLLTMAIFFSAGFLQQATIEDRQNRVIEILLSSTTPEQLLMGKIVGLGAAGLLQVGIYVVLIIIPGTTLLSVFRVPVDALVLSLVYFMIGYLLFAALMAGTGMIGRTPQESAQLGALWTLAAASPMFFMPALATAPNGGLARALSFFPLSSPVTMILRLTTGDVPLVDIVLSIVIGVVSVYALLRAAAKIFRASSLMYGKRATLPEVLRWLRAS